MNKALRFLFLVFIPILGLSASGQDIKFVEVSGGGEISLYSWYRNPSYSDSYLKTSGSLGYNPGLNLGVTLGSEKIGIGLHGRGALNFFNFDINQCKGMSAYNYGFLGSIYFGHPHSYSKFSLILSVGLQWNQTEFWMKPRAYRMLHRQVFQTNVYQIAFKYPKDENILCFVRVGKGPGNSMTIEGGLMVLMDLIEHYKN